jgi:hypothetical protein
VNAPHELSSERRTRFGFRRYSSIELLGSLIALFALTPLVEDLPGGDFIEVCIMTVVLVSAMLAIGGHRRTLLIAGALLVPAVAGKWLNHLHPHLVPPHYFLGFGLAFMAFVVMHLLRFILRAAHVNAEVLCAGISVYLIIGLIWTLTYVLVGKIAPDSFAFSGAADAKSGMTGFNAFYFSFVTLSTVGFGDVTPVSKIARTLATMEAITGTFYITVLIARLVAMYAPARGEATNNPTDP